jgi:DNA-binding PadR family transcriptional regulator
MTYTRVWKLPEQERHELPTIPQRLIVLEIMYLLLNPRSGYDLHKQLRLTFGFDASYGSLYPWLRALERGELVTSQWVKREDRLITPQMKRVYCLTEKGKEELRKSLQELTFLAATMTKSLPPETKEFEADSPEAYLEQVPPVPEPVSY